MRAPIILKIKLCISTLLLTVSSAMVQPHNNSSIANAPIRPTGQLSAFGIDTQKLNSTNAKLLKFKSSDKPSDQLAEEQRLALQIITDTSDKDSEGGLGASSSNHAKHRSGNIFDINTDSGSISFGEQYNSLDSESGENNARSNHEKSSPKRIVINLNSMEPNKTDFNDGQGTKLTIGITSIKNQPKVNQMPRVEQKAVASNRDKTEKSAAAASLSKSASNTRVDRNNWDQQVDRSQLSVARRKSMRENIMGGIARQGGVPAMVVGDAQMDEPEMLIEGQGEPEMKLMLNSETVDNEQKRTARQKPARSAQSNASGASRDMNLQAAIESLTDEIDAIKKQLDNGGVRSSGGRYETAAQSHQQPLTIGKFGKRDPRSMSKMQTPAGFQGNTPVVSNINSGRSQDYASERMKNRVDDVIQADSSYGKSESDYPQHADERVETDASNLMNAKSNDYPGQRMYQNVASKSGSDSIEDNSQIGSNSDGPTLNYEQEMDNSKSSESRLNPNDHATRRWPIDSQLNGNQFSLDNHNGARDKNDQIPVTESTSQQSHENENRMNDMSASVTSENGVALDSAPNDNSQSSQDHRQPPIESSYSSNNSPGQQSAQIESKGEDKTGVPMQQDDTKTDEKVARILRRLKLYTTKDQLMKVAQDLQGNQDQTEFAPPRDFMAGLSAAEHEDMRQASRGSFMMPQQSDRHPMALLNSIRATDQMDRSWPLMHGETLVSRASDPMPATKSVPPPGLTRKQIINPVNDKLLESLISSATAPMMGHNLALNGRELGPSDRNSPVQTQNRQLVQPQAQQHQQPQQIAGSGVKLLADFRGRQERLRDIERSSSQRSFYPDSSDQLTRSEGDATTTRVSADETSGPDHHTALPTPSIPAANHGHRSSHNYESQAEHPDAADYTGLRDIKETMKQNEGNFDEENDGDNSDRNDGHIAREGLQFIHDPREQQKEFDGEDGPEASENSSVKTSSDRARSSGEADLKAIEEIIDELVRREKEQKVNARAGIGSN